MDLQQEKPFEKQILFSEEEVIDAYLWAKRDIEILKDPDDSVHSQNADRSTSVYWVCHNEQDKVTARIIQNIKDMQ